jgi:cobaltochelatase CobS
MSNQRGDDVAGSTTKLTKGNMTMTIKLSSNARNAVRSAVTASAAWDSYRKANGLSSADLSGETLLQAAAVCGVDVATVAANADANDDDNAHRPYDEAAVGDLREAFNNRSHAMTPRERGFCTSVFTTIHAKGGRATERQYNALSKAIGRAKTSNNAAPVVANPFENVPLAPVAPVVPSVNAAADPAGAALAALVAPHLIATVQTQLNAAIERALSNVPSVRIEIAKANGEFKQITGATHTKMSTLLKAATARTAKGGRMNIWLTGPAATGKTHAAELVADALELPFYTHGAMAMTHELMGFIDAGGTYQRTAFREAFENGGVCLFDEVDSWESQPTLALNAALANGCASFPDGMVKRHPDCIIIAAANTNGNGATAEYVGRNKLDAAFLSRFAIKIDWQRDVAFELAIGGDEAFTRRVQAARERAKAAGLKHNIDTRHAQAGASLIAAGFTPDEAAELTYLAGLNSDQRRMVEGKAAA